LGAALGPVAQERLNGALKLAQAWLSEQRAALACKVGAPCTS
jgi:hypothetical protein